MREHQIVITLKPEQFLEVQRLARVAGAKSMGMFVRQRLLSALGMEGAAPLPEKATGGADVRRVTGELRRLHGELKAFVGESLAHTYIGQPEADSLPEVGDGLPLLDSDQVMSEFLGAEMGSPMHSPGVEAVMADFAQARDELEEIAQRAFAISPRLGALEGFEEAAPAEAQAGGERDPLDDLLDDPLMNQMEGYLDQSRQSEPAVTEDSAGPAEEGEEPEADEVIDVTLPIAGRAKKTADSAERKPPPPAPPPPPSPPGPQSGPPPGGISGGPPPRRRQ